MLIYNITCIVENKVSADFEEWMCGDGAHSFMENELLAGGRLMEVTDPANPDGRGFALQLESTASTETLRQWEQCAVPELLSRWRSDWSRYLVYFTTIMQPIEICSPD